MLVNLEKLRAATASHQKMESYPKMVYDPIRHDVRKYIEEQAPELARSVGTIAVRRLKDGTGYGGVLFADAQPFFYVMTGRGFKFKSANNADAARTISQTMLDMEQARSRLIRRRESARDMDQLTFDLSRPESAPPLYVHKSTTKEKRARSQHQPVGRWIRVDKRKAIYKRDGNKCLHCGKPLARVDSQKRTLDHLKPVSEGGTNDASNVFTSCKQCNAKRGKKRLGGKVMKRIKLHVARDLDKAQYGAGHTCNLCGMVWTDDSRCRCIQRALPQSGKEQPVKQAKKPIAAGEKKQGDGPKGKVRYNYPTEKGKPGAAPKIQKEEPKMQQVPAEQKQDAKPNPRQEAPEHEYVDPAKLAALLGVSVGVLRKVAVKFQQKKDRDSRGRNGFVDFMVAQLKKLADKHDLDAKYFGLVYDSLVGMPASKPTQSEEKSK